MVLSMGGRTGFISPERTGFLFQVRVAKGIYAGFVSSWHVTGTEAALTVAIEPQPACRTLKGRQPARVNRIGKAATFAEIVNQENRL